MSLFVHPEEGEGGEKCSCFFSLLKHFFSSPKGNCRLRSIRELK